MRKKLTAILLVAVLMTGLGAQSYGFRSFGTDPFLSPSYSDRFQDALVGPWQLPRVEDDPIFYMTAVMSEEWDLDELMTGGKLSWIQNARTEIEASFVGKNLALSAFSSTYFADRRPAADPVYDIFNTLAIQIDWGLSFSWFSFGATIRGGSEMIRDDRALSDWSNAMANAYFSSFRHADGRDFFSLGLGASVDAGIVGFSVGTGDVITLRDGDIYVGWDAILDSLSISASLRYPEFTRRGDLNLVRPRMSWTIEGNPASHDMTASVRGELLFQLLPDLDLSFGLGYRETGHGWFDFDAGNGLLMTGFSVRGERFGVSVMLNVDTGTWRTLSPALSVTLAR